MSTSMELRTLFVDSTHTSRDGAGSYRLMLPEQMEIPGGGMVAYVDDVSLAGQISAVNLSRSVLMSSGPANMPDGTGTWTRAR